MEPVPVTRTVRRTVRMAVVLVIGQALLCALIGWIVFGHSFSTRPPGAPPVDRLAVPPMVIPPPPGIRQSAPAATERPRSVGMTEDELGPSVVRGGPALPGSAVVPEPFVASPSSAPAAVLPSGELSVPLVGPSGTAPVYTDPAFTDPASTDPPSIEPVPDTTDGAASEAAALLPVPTPAPPVPSDDGATLMPIRVGAPCRVPDEYAYTANGVLVQCLPDERDQLYWEIVEQR